MPIQLIFFFMVVYFVWVIDINIIRSELDKLGESPDKHVSHTEIIITKYEKHLMKNVIIGITPWGDLCSINDPNKEFENIVCKHMNTSVNIYYTTIHTGFLIFGKTNRVVNIVPIYKK